jgi:hypothetical protein
MDVKKKTLIGTWVPRSMKSKLEQIARAKGLRLGTFMRIELAKLCGIKLSSVAGKANTE